jgi:hypothetical protein
MIASFAALQDWDAVYLFAYSHDSHYEKDHIDGFFNIEGNPTKMPFMPLAARIFLGRDTAGAIAPLKDQLTVDLQRDNMLATASKFHHTIWPFVRQQAGLNGTDLMTTRLAVSFSNAPSAREKGAIRARWTDHGDGTGQYSVAGEHGIVFAGFKSDSPIDLGPLRIESMQTPFEALMLVPADPTQPIATADRLLLAAVARSKNTGMVRSPDRTSVSDQWGKAPALIEVVAGVLSLAGHYKLFAITPGGTRGDAIDTHITNGRTILPIGKTATVWYELERQK